MKFSKEARDLLKVAKKIGLQVGVSFNYDWDFPSDGVQYKCDTVFIRDNFVGEFNYAYSYVSPEWAIRKAFNAAMKFNPILRAKWEYLKLQEATGTVASVKARRL